MSILARLLTGSIGFKAQGSQQEEADLSSAVTLSVPSGAINLLIEAKTADVAYRLDGTAATSSDFLIPTGEPRLIPVAGLSSLSIIAADTGATAIYQWME